jgi:hypothetical protein
LVELRPGSTKAGQEIMGSTHYPLEEESKFPRETGDGDAS